MKFFLPSALPLRRCPFIEEDDEGHGEQDDLESEGEDRSLPLDELGDRFRADHLLLL